MKEVSRVLLMGLACLLPAACTYVVPKVVPQPQKQSEGPPGSVKYDLRTLALYSGFVAGLTAEERETECMKLVRGEAGDPASIGVRLHTALVMQITPQCGGPEKAIPLFEGARKRLSSDPPLSAYLAYQSHLAWTLVEEKQKKTVDQDALNRATSRNTRLKNQLAARDAELKQLKATLDALKRIEKTFHQRD